MKKEDFNEGFSFWQSLLIGFSMIILIFGLALVALVTCGKI